MTIVQDKGLLSFECKDVSLLEAHGIIAKLEDELNASKVPGVGLAANQIGINAKVCIIRVPGLEPINLVNPKIVDKYDLGEFDNEGCLSFPGDWITTKRYGEVVIKDAIHPAGMICVGTEAVVVQHEISHLYGETMYDYRIKRPGPNLPCWCGSKKKYKKCHSGKLII